MSANQSDTLVWISGATAGIGGGFLRTCPYDDARIVNLSRGRVEGIENVHLDLADPDTWPGVVEHFNSSLAAFEGSRAIFVHNAFYAVAPSFVGEGRGAERYRENIANFTAGLVLGEAFIEAVLTHRPTIESGLVMLSSAAARIPWEGRSAYCAAKAGMEHWVRVVRRERAMRGVGPWVVAVRPGFVDTPGTRSDANYPAEDYPIAPMMAAAFETMEGVLTPDEAARDIWTALPDGGPGQSVLLFGAPPEGAGSATKI
jgi:NAD(P)-dependent dehydrogenase (short-subunit alcohol dehydrogenase family)